MIWVLLIAAALLIGSGVSYNKLVAMRRLTENAWADVDVYLKRRAELVPNLVEAVKGAAAYEKGTFEQIASARTRALGLPGPSPERASAEATLAQGVNQVVAVAESYPQLRASDNFLALQRDLSDNERLIASARQYYNACVRDYNTMLESFPQNLIAGLGGFRPKEFFEIEDITERSAPGVKGLS
jgi:LemA protein